MSRVQGSQSAWKQHSEGGDRLVVVVPDATPVIVPLGVIVDGQTLNVDLAGAGSIPGATTTNNYVLALAAATFTRQAGVGFLSTVANIETQSGAPVTWVFQHVDGPTETVCQLEITAAAFPYVNHFRVSPILKF